MIRRPRARLAAALSLLLVVPAARAASVSGRVLDSGGTPVAGVTVVSEAYRTEERTRVDETKGVTPSSLAETKTDADGRFRLTIEKPGVEVSIRMLPGALPGALLEGPFDSSEDVALDELELPAVEKVSGRVTDEMSNPIAGAKLRTVSGFGLEEEDVSFYAEATTGADGSFSITNSPIGGGGLNARAPGYAPFARPGFQRRAVANVTLKSGGTIQGTVLDPSGKPAEGAIVVCGLLAAQTDASGMFRLAGVLPGTHTVEALWKNDFAAQKDTVRIKKGEAAGVSLRLARAAAVAGTVVDEKTRRPLPGVRVSASTGAFFNRGERSSRRGRTDAKGRFRISGLASRRYNVRAAKSEYLPVSMPGVVATVAAPGTVSIALQKAAGITGRVTDEAGTPVVGARVRIARDLGVRALLRGGGPAALLERPGVTTGPDGIFRLRGLAPEKNLTLEAAKAGYVTAKRHGVNLKVGELVKDLALVVKRGLEAKGRIIDTAGKPVAGAEIRVSRPEGGPGRFMIQMAGINREKPNASSAADGTFRVAGLEAGEYALAVSRDGYAAKRVPSVTVQAKGPNEWPPIVLQVGVAIAGSVRNSKGEPVVGAQIFSFGEGTGPREGATDPEGRFRLDGLSSERPVMMSVRADGYAPLQRSVTPPAEDLSLVLKTSGTIRGRVEDAATSRPVADFTASYREQRGSGFGGIRISVGGGPGERSFQSSDGTFELTDVPPGKWTVTASSPGYRPAEVAGIEIGEGETKEGVVLSLKEGGVVTGRVLDPRRGTGVPNAGVSWREESGGMGGPAAAALARLGGGDSQTQTTDADGRFRFEGLSDGRITLTAEHPDFLEVSKEIEIQDESTVDLTLSVGGTIAGSVVGKDGRTPTPGAEVLLDEQGATFRMGGGDATRADNSGNFLFEHLKAGRYRVSARSNAGSSSPKDIVLMENQRLDGILLEMATGALVRGTVSGLPPERLGGVRISGTGKDYEESTLTGDDGTFTLRDVPPGVLRVAAMTSFPASRSASRNIDVPEGAPEVPVEIVFEGASRLSGRVTRGERPVSGVFVMAAADPPSAGTMRGMVQTDENGQYTIEGLVDGNYQVALSGQGISYRKAFVVSGDTNGDIALPAMTISGTVTEIGSSEPLEGARVQLESGGSTSSFGLKSAVTDSRGFYSIDDVDSGSYQVTARKEGYQLKTQPVSIGSSSVELDLSLARGAGLAIRAIDGLTGLPLHGLTVLAYSEAGTVAYSGSLSLDREGKGEIASLGPGRYALHLFSDGYATRSLPAVTVPSPMLSVPLTPGGRVEIRSEAPLSGRLLDASGSPYLFSPFGRDGRLSVPAPVAAWEHIAPGTYQLIVSGASGEKSYPFAVSEGRTTTLDVR
jgi:protocatechuate 3,4-dioxygenase beta subunit